MKAWHEQFTEGPGPLDASRDKASLLGQQGAPIGLHLLQTLGEVAVAGLQLVDPVQSRAELRGNRRKTNFSMSAHVRREEQDGRQRQSSIRKRQSVPAALHFS